MLLEPLHQLILEYLEHTDLPIFLTGKAGTGKTTFLRHIRETSNKNLAIVAPTAVAAINAGGVTIHSFFQMPFGPVLPNANEFSARSFSQEKSKLIRCLDLLIIDEISMVRADTMDYIDRALKFIKGSSRPFGGVQVLMIGDLYQLPPVYQNDWHLLSRFYTGPYFFYSLIFHSTKPLTFELSKVHRQSDPLFIKILNEVRSGKISETHLKALNEHYNPEDTKDLSDYVTLTTHNPLVREINEQRLAELPGMLHRFKATITGDFPAEGYPTEEELQLKQGAMVMFIKNDSSGEKKFYNGRTATVTNINGESITVRFLDDQSEFDATREIWENTKYALSESDGKVTQSSAGSFTQFPIRLAWAITIHKSQGLTFDRAVIDAGAAFAHGQTYVALSRCRNLEGLVLKQKIEPKSIITDPAVKNFMDTAIQRQPNQNDLELAKQETNKLKLLGYFDFRPLTEAHFQLKQVFSEIMPKELLIEEKFQQTTALLESRIAAVSARFATRELEAINDINDSSLIERINKSAQYFAPLLIELKDSITSLHELTESAAYHPDYFPALNTLLSQLENKLGIFTSLTSEINITEIEEQIKTKSASYRNLDGWKKKPVELKIENPALFAELSTWRKQKAEEKKTLTHHIMPDQTMVEVSAKLPRTLTALSKIKSFGEGRASEYGEDILRIIRSHLGESGLFG